MALRYKILIPVLAQVDDFMNLLTQCPDPKCLIIVDNLYNNVVGVLRRFYEKQGAQTFHYPGNLGCAASWNIGLRQLQDGQMDYLIILSPSCRWKRHVTDLAEAIERQEDIQPQDFYLCESDNHITDTHAFAITRRGVDKLGLFDENFHPVYFEDTDYTYRSTLAGVDRFPVRGLRTSAALNGGVSKDPRVWRQYQLSAERLKEYYVEKWGGEPGREKWTTPFGDEKLGPNDWVLDKTKLVKLPTKKELKRAGLL